MDKDTLFSSFGKWVAPIFIEKFQEHIRKSGQDKYTKKLTTTAYTLLLLHAHLESREGLRAIAADALNEDFHEILGFTSISASQLSRKHNQVDPAVLATLFAELAQRLHLLRTHTCAWKQDMKIIDSSTISLGLTTYKWATFRKTKAGVKIHLRLVFVDEKDVLPEKVIVTQAKLSDRSQMGFLIDETDATYVFDRGYVDYERFDRYCDTGIFFVTRLKKNAVTRTLHWFPVSETSEVLSDRMVLIGTPQKRMDNVLRLIETVDTKGHVLRILTNRFDLTAEEIGDMYRSRWAIELFFKWIKQHAKVKTFYGTSENAVANQVLIALIYYCLLLLVKRETQTTRTVLELSRLLKSCLWKPWQTWLERIDYRPKRTSRGRQKKKPVG
jgi:IS4 transposase